MNDSHVFSDAPHWSRQFLLHHLGCSETVTIVYYALIYHASLREELCNSSCRLSIATCAKSMVADDMVKITFDPLNVWSPLSCV